MKNNIKHLTISLFILLSAPIYADDDNDEAKRLVESGEIIELEVILRTAREIQAGKVIEVELERKYGKRIYEIELLAPDGTVFELKFDAKSGNHLSTEKED